MKVRLTQDVMEKDKDDKVVGLKVALRPGRAAVAFTKGAVVEMSEASARKYVERGWAEPAEEEEGESDE